MSETFNIGVMPFAFMPRKDITMVGAFTLYSPQFALAGIPIFT